MTNVFDNFLLFTSFILKPNFYLKTKIMKEKSRLSMKLLEFVLDQVKQLVQLVRAMQDIVYVENVY